MAEEHLETGAAAAQRAGHSIDKARWGDLGDVFRRAFEDAPIAMAIVGLDGRLLRPNQALVEMVGRSRDELLFMEPEELAHPDDAGLNAHEMRRAIAGEGDSYRLEKRWTDALGHAIWVCVSASLVRDEQGRPLYFVWHVEDGSIRKREASRLQRLADHDSLTGLSNRRRFHELLSRQVARSRRYGEVGSVLVLDLDGFKSVNDRLGHAAGDEVLRTVAAIVSGRIRDSDLVARLGGDEFGVLLLGVGAESAANIAQELSAAIERVDRTPTGRPVSITASIGCAVIAQTVHDADDVLAAADAAMYTAKQAGKTFALADVAAVGAAPFPSTGQASEGERRGRFSRGEI